MRKHKRRSPGSGNVAKRLPLLRRHKTDNVVKSGEYMSTSDITAMREGSAIIRRGQHGRSDKAFHDSILWNSNIRKTWIRRAIELSDQTKILGIYLANVEK